MAAINDLQMAPLLLSTLFTDDPRLSLIQAIAWLDPASLEGNPPDEDVEFNYDGEDELTSALHVCRRCFPEVYAAANQLLLQGVSPQDVEHYLCTGINAHLVTPLDHLEDSRYGPPLECYGVDVTLLESADESEQPYTLFAPAFALFRITVGHDHPADVWQRAGIAATVLQHSLENRTAPPYEDLCALISWMFSISGNTLIDWSQEALWENGTELPDWTLDEIDFINDMTHEAHEMMDAVIRSKEALEDDTVLCNALERNLKHIFKTLDKKGKTHARTHYSDAECTALAHCLTWPDRDGDSTAS